MTLIKEQVELENYLKSEYGNRLDDVDRPRFSRGAKEVERKDIEYPCILVYTYDAEYTSHTDYHYEVIYPGDFYTKNYPVYFDYTR